MIDRKLASRIHKVHFNEKSMSSFNSQKRRRFSEAARAAALIARKAKLEQPDSFGTPELFVVKASDQAFTWELRRFGGIILERGLESFASVGLARADGEKALITMCAAPGLAKFKRQNQPRANPIT